MQEQWGSSETYTTIILEVSALTYAVNPWLTRPISMCNGFIMCSSCITALSWLAVAVSKILIRYQNSEDRSLWPALHLSSYTRFYNSSGAAATADYLHEASVGRFTWFRLWIALLSTKTVDHAPCVASFKFDNLELYRYVDVCGVVHAKDPREIGN